MHSCIKYLLYKLFLYSLISGNLTNLIDAIPLDGPKVDRAKVNEFPFIASLQTKVPFNQRGEKHLCTGSLITDKDVLTAGHCVTHKTPEKVQVLLGVVDVDSVHPMYNVSWMISYDQWTDKFRQPRKFVFNDIGIVRLSRSVEQGNIQPVAITDLRTPQLYRSEAIMVGWGFLPHKGRIVRHLRKANVHIYAQDYCLRQLYLMTDKHYIFESNKLCTASKPFTVTNHGDSGGPLLSKNNELVGVIYGTGTQNLWGNFSQEFLNQYEVNVHISIDYYREFMSFVADMI